ncbi:MAG TPA: hypothetical protein VKU41_16465 [Polyangiaceae bacterium]|nr:hypothetical protein [Polyangiaceae bacterium]
MAINLGPLGIVVYAGTTIDQVDDDKFYYIPEDQWTRLPQITPLSMGPEVVAAALQPGAGGTQYARRLFMDFDRLNVSSSQPTNQTSGIDRTATAAGTGTPQDWSVVVRRGGECREVPASKFTPLPPDSQGDAGVLVRRGAVVASIPQNSIPSGSYCVLGNFATVTFPSGSR